MENVGHKAGSEKNMKHRKSSSKPACCWLRWYIQEHFYGDPKKSHERRVEILKQTDQDFLAPDCSSRLIGQSRFNHQVPWTWLLPVKVEKLHFNVHDESKSYLGGSGFLLRRNKFPKAVPLCQSPTQLLEEFFCKIV